MEGEYFAGLIKNSRGK